MEIGTTGISAQMSGGLGRCKEDVMDAALVSVFLDCVVHRGIRNYLAGPLSWFGFHPVAQVWRNLLRACLGRVPIGTCGNKSSCRDEDTHSWRKVASE